MSSSSEQEGGSIIRFHVEVDMSGKAATGDRSPFKRVRNSTQRQPSVKREADRDSAPELDIKAQATLYDAVAGRISRDGFILSSDQKPAPPDEVLFSRANAPVRYVETDTYFAHRHLSSGVRLPDSDLMKTIHAYVSDFYGSGALKDCELDWGSMDETALMAIGILLEEAAAVKLGNSGDLAFVEGEERKPSSEEEGYMDS